MSADDPRTVPSADIDPLLRRSLEESQRLGFIGRRSIDEVVDHARWFVDAIAPAGADPSGLVLDLGAGGGLPGLVIGHDLPLTRLTLLDRRATRTDFLSRVVRRLRWDDRVDVLTQDAAHPSPDQVGSFDAVVARGFGPPATTLRIAADWVRPGGMIVISEPPVGDRWATVDLVAFAVGRVNSHPSVAVFLKH